MKRRERWYQLFLFGLLVLLLSGGSRLIAGDRLSETETLPLGTAGAFEAHCVPAETAVQETVPPEQRLSMVLGSSDTEVMHAEVPAMQSVRRDSNGNVLSDRGYMRSVYRCFAPENGFG